MHDFTIVKAESIDGNPFSDRIIGNWSLLQIIIKRMTSDRKSDIRQGRRIMEKIQMTTPLVEMDGDEMTRISGK